MQNGFVADLHQSLREFSQKKEVATNLSQKKKVATNLSKKKKKKKVATNLLAVVLVQVVADLLGGSKHLQELGQLIVLQAPSQLRLGTRKNNFSVEINLIPRGVCG